MPVITYTKREKYCKHHMENLRLLIRTLPVRILMSIFLGRKPDPREPKPGCAAPIGIAPKLVPG